MLNVDDATKKRFWEKVDIGSDDECWEWLGCKRQGSSITGCWSPGKQTGLSTNVHKAAYQLTYGEVPKGKRIRHTCSSPTCCNPNHLKVGDDLEERFWSKVDKTPGLGKRDCWLWISRINQGGYGQFRPNPKKPHTVAHRTSWELSSGKAIPENMVICHKCDIRHCVNPDHLFLGTTYDNIHDMITKGRSNFIPPPPQVGSKSKNAKLTESDVLAIRKLLDSNVSYQEIMKRYQISNTLVYAIKNRKNWKHI